MLGRFALWEEDGSGAVELSIDALTTQVLSFTLTDSFFCYRSTNLRGVQIPPRPYHRRLYRLEELDEALERYSLPTDHWRDDPALTFDVYVEAQVWSDAAVLAARPR